MKASEMIKTMTPEEIQMLTNLLTKGNNETVTDTAKITPETAKVKGTKVKEVKDTDICNPGQLFSLFNAEKIAHKKLVSENKANGKFATWSEFKTNQLTVKQVRERLAVADKITGFDRAEYKAKKQAEKKANKPAKGAEIAGLKEQIEALTAIVAKIAK